jgi:hypothetical protein
MAGLFRKANPQSAAWTVFSGYSLWGVTACDRDRYRGGQEAGAGCGHSYHSSRGLGLFGFR